MDKKLLHILPILIIFTACGESVGPVLPHQVFYSTPAVPEEKVEVIIDAMNVWNDALNMELFTYGGEHEEAWDIEDGINTIHWASDEDFYDESDIGMALFQAYEFAGGNIGPEEILQCDIRIRASDFKGPTELDGEEETTITSTFGDETLLSTLLHEFGHCMALYYGDVNPADEWHSPNEIDIMYPKMRSDANLLSVFDIMRAEKALRIRDEEPSWIMESHTGNCKH